MENQADINYNRIARAIDYIRENFRNQPKIDEIAEQIHVSPSHFKRMFTQWAGTSPKRFLQYISVEYAKRLLKEQQATLFDTAYETGFSSTSRLHDLFIHIEGMTPAEYKNGGRNLEINYGFAGSPFGNLLLASTPKGLCSIAFVDNKEQAFKDLVSKFPNATYHNASDLQQERAMGIFHADWTKLASIKLHLKGTDFQLKVWESLLKIPMGKLSTYNHIARELGNPKASRAVGTAIGRNPIAYLIPCHRVIQSSGNLSGYHWGTTRKTAIIGWEQAKIHP